MSLDIKQAFADEGNSVSKAFFGTTEVNEKNWSCLELLAKSDDVTFWTIVANHTRLGEMLNNFIISIDNSHSSATSAFRRSVLNERESHLLSVIIRLIVKTDFPLSRRASVTSISERINEVLSIRILPTLSLMALRKNGVVASIITTAAFIVCPGYLPSLQLYVNDFCNTVERLAQKCAVEMKRGRYQRQAGDILSLVERTYRCTKCIWALCQSSPFVTEYMDLIKVLRSLRIIVDIVSPCLQHFLIVSDTLKNKREILSRANYMIVNAAINTSSILILFRSYETTKNVHAYCCPKMVHNTYSGLNEYLLQYVKGIPFPILNSKNFKTIPELMLFFSTPDKEQDSRCVGKVLLKLTEPIPDSNDFSDVGKGSRNRFMELLLMELVRQGFHIDSLLAQGFIDASEGQQLGVSESNITRALAGLDTEPLEYQTSAPAVSVNQTQSTTDPSVLMVLDIFPHYNVDGIKACLNYYNNDAEQFILDASMENLPPHLLSQLTDSEPTAEEDVETRTTVNHLTTSDYDTEVTDQQLYTLLGKDLYDHLLGSDEDSEDENSEADSEIKYKTYESDDNIQGDAFNIDDSLKEKIRLLNEIMYEDEFDDGQLEDVRADDMDNDEVPTAPPRKYDDPSNQEVKQEEAPKVARNAYNDKRYHEQRSKQRREQVKEIQKSRSNDGPSYTKKAKTKKEKGGKRAVDRAVKKGRTME